MTFRMNTLPRQNETVGTVFVLPVFCLPTCTATFRRTHLLFVNAMRYFATFLLLLAFGFALPACAQHPKKTTQKVKIKKATKKAAVAKPIPAKSETGPVLTFERTPCFGTCPAYTMQVFADGRVVYEGRRGVPMLGTKELKLPASAVTDMLRQAKEARFEQFQDRYSQNTTDLPSTIIAVRQPGGQLKTVVLEEGAPENVRQLFTYIGNQLDALAKLNTAAPSADR